MKDRKGSNTTLLPENSVLASFFTTISGRNVQGKRYVNTKSLQHLSGALKRHIIHSSINRAVRQEYSGAWEISQAKDCWVMARPTCEDWSERLQGIKRTFQSARLHCAGQQLEDTILGDKREGKETLLQFLDTFKMSYPTLKRGQKPLLQRFTQLYLLYLSVPSDFNVCTGGVESPRPTGIHMCEVVVVEDPDKVSTLQLEQEEQKHTGWAAVKGAE